jgi:hypothetical protein
MGFIKNKGSKLFQLAQLLPQMEKSVNTSNARDQRSRMCSASASGIGLLRSTAPARSCPDLIDEDYDRSEIATDRQFAEGEQGAGGQREVGPARLTAPARGVSRTAAIVEQDVSRLHF